MSLILHRALMKSTVDQDLPAPSTLSGVRSGLKVDMMARIRITRNR